MLEGLLAGTIARTPFALILLDVRNLPEINATLGHHVGDDGAERGSRDGCGRTSVAAIWWRACRRISSWS